MDVRVAGNALIRPGIALIRPGIEPLTSYPVFALQSALRILRKIWEWTGG